MTDDLRSKHLDPEAEQERWRRSLGKRLDDIEARIERIEKNRVYRNRYSKLRGFRTFAIRYLYSLDKLSLGEIGAAFGLTRQRIEQIVKRKAT